MLNQPLIVTGTPRAGKTCIAELLAALDEFTHVIEPISIWNKGLDFGKCDFRDASEATDDIKAAIRQDCEAAVASAPESRYLDDLAYHATRIPFLNAVMPECKVIHVVRDPRECVPEMIYGWTYRDTVVKALGRRRKNLKLSTLPRLGWRFIKNYIRSRTQSHRETWGPMPQGLDEIVRSQPVAIVAAEQWSRVNQSAYDALAQLPEDRWMRIRFEDLISDPAAVAEQIAQFADIQHKDKLIQLATKTIEKDYHFLKKVPVPDSEQDAVRTIIEPLRARLGYQEYTTNNRPEGPIHDNRIA